MAIRLRGELIEAVLLDVDGTLYELARMQLHMALELARLPVERRSLAEARRVWRCLRVFRRVREELRALGRPSEDSLDKLQYSVPAERLGVSASELESLVREWMHQRPLRFLSGCRRRGVAEFLELMRSREVRLGVFSDYPCEAKLSALGVSSAIDLRVSAVDREVNAFKPHPGGFLRASALWGLPPSRVLYIGDRPTVDGRGARAAGMPYVIVGRSAGSEIRASGDKVHGSFLKLIDAIGRARL